MVLYKTGAALGYPASRHRRDVHTPHHDYGIVQRCQWPCVFRPPRLLGVAVQGTIVFAATAGSQETALNWQCAGYAYED